MKTALTLTCFLLSSFFVQSQTYNSSCVPSGNMVDVYRNDAYLLAVKRLNVINSTWKDSVIVPEIYIDSIARALYAIQNMDYSPVKDTITTLFGSSIFNDFFFPLDSVHMHDPGDWNYAFTLKKIRITVVSTEMWSAPINELISRYNLTVTLSSTQGSPSGTIYDVASPIALNIPALRNQFLAITGVVYAESFYRFGGGNTITANIINGDVYLAYSIGCGDCLSGCTYGRIWFFKVNTSTDCSVEYISAVDWGLRLVIPDIFPLCTPPIVPIELTSIRVSQNANFQLIEWKMAMEDNVVKYTIERSTDGIRYTSIGEINITHSSPGPVSYNWRDSEFNEGEIYYRVKISSNAGEKKYSPVASVNVKASSGIRVFPTLLRSNTINIQLRKVEKGDYTVDLLSTSGQKLFSTVINVTTGSITKEITIPALYPGMYILAVRSKTTKVNQFIYRSE